MTTTLDVVTNAFLEAGIFAAGETLNAQDANFGLSKLNRMLDTWNTSKLYVFAVNFTQYTMIASKNPQTIGKAFKVTGTSLTSNVATITGVPTATPFKLGQLVTTVNIDSNAAYNVTGQAIQSISADGSSFTLNITHADIAFSAATGVAIPSTQPVSAAPDFPIVSTRPVKIVNANIILNQGTSFNIVRVPMRIVDADWWANQRVPQIQTTLPTHLYYQPSFPNGELFFWPVPQVAYPVELETWTDLSQVALTDTFQLPPGYEDAITYTLAATLCPAYGRPIDSTLAALGAKARALIQSLNSGAPLITTADLGVPGTTDQRGRADFNWKTGNLSG